MVARSLPAVVVLVALSACARPTREAVPPAPAASWAREIEATKVAATCPVARTIELRRVLPDGSTDVRVLTCAGDEAQVTVSRSAPVSDREVETEQSVMTVALPVEVFQGLYAKAAANAATLQCPRIASPRLVPRSALVLRVGAKGDDAVVCDLDASADRWRAWVASTESATPDPGIPLEEEELWKFKTEYWRDELRYASGASSRR